MNIFEPKNLIEDPNPSNFCLGFSVLFLFFIQAVSANFHQRLHQNQQFSKILIWCYKIEDNRTKLTSGSRYQPNLATSASIPSELD